MTTKPCDGCGTTDVHADICPALDPVGQPLPCTRTKSHPPHKYMLNRTARRCPGIGDLRSVGDLYFCPTVGEIESTGHGGFKVCCAHPELHVYLGYSTPGIEAIAQYLSDQARDEYTGPLIHLGQQDPTTIKMPSDADEARQELLRLQALARTYRDQYLSECAYIWAQTIHTEDDGLLHLPVYAADGSETEGIVCTREDAVTLQAMLTDYLADCPSDCDDDCDVACHETHAIPRKRHHPVGEHVSENTPLEHVATALARHDLMNSVGLEPHEELPDKDHPFWTMWRGNARTAITAYNGYIERSGHRYLSTGCRHGEHGYCQSNTGSQGDKIPAQCKFCGSGCVCSCHLPGTVTVVERIVNPEALAAATYAEKVNAPLTERTVMALNKRLNSGDVPVLEVEAKESQG
jgi:hypothetical protein